MPDPGAVIARSLREAVLRSVAGHATTSLLFSGGVDSSVVAWLLKAASHPVELVSVSLAGGADASTAEESASIMGLACHRHTVTASDVLDVARGLRREHPDLSLNDVALQTSMRLAISKAAHRAVLTAQGADTLFLGYAHVKDLSGDLLVLRAQADLEKLTGSDLPRTRAYAETLGKELIAPFLDPTFVRTASAVPWEERRRETENKWLLRAAARELGLPAEIVNRPKRTFQYGSGIYTELKKHL